MIESSKLIQSLTINNKTSDISEQKKKLQNEFLDYVSMMDKIIIDYNNLKDKSINDEKIINDLHDELNNMNKVSIITNMNKQIEKLKKDNLILQKKLDFYKKSKTDVNLLDYEDSDEDSVDLILINKKYYYINENIQPNDLYEALKNNEDYDVGNHIGTLVNGKIILN